MSDLRGVADSGNSGQDILRLKMLQFTVVAATLAWSLNVVSFLDVKEAAIWIGVLLLSMVYPRSRLALASGFAALGPCWITLGAVAIIGVVLAPVPALVLGEGLRLLPLLLLVTLSFDLLQHPVYRVRVLRAMAFASASAAALALLQRADALPALFPRFAHYDQTMYSVFGNEGLLAGALAVALTCLPGTRDPEARHRGGMLLQVAMAALMIGTLLLAASRGGLAAALAGLCGLLLLKILPARRVVVALAGALTIAALLHGIPGAALWERWMGTFSAGDTGGNFRRWALRASLALVAQHPVPGCGLGHFSRTIPLLLGAVAPEGGVGANELITEHAHLDVLEWIGETGLAGAAGLIWVLSRLRLRFPVALCGLLAAGVFSLTHPAFYSAPHALVALLLYGMNVNGRTTKSWCPPARQLQFAALSMAIVGSAVFGATVLYPSFLLCRAEDRHLGGEDAREDYERATQSWGFHPDACESFGIYCYEQGDFDTALASFQRARAGLDTGRIYQLLAMAAEARGEHEASCQWYGECLLRWPWDRRIQAQRAMECSRK